MMYLPPPGKRLKVRRFELKPAYFQNKTSKKNESLNKPQNFEQKLRKLREIIKDPLIYEN